MEQSLGQEAVASVKWQTATTGFQVVARLVVGVVLARLLSPADFGIAGFAMIFSEFLTLFSELGIGAALVQRERLADLHLRVGFTLSALLGAASTVLLWSTAPLLADAATLQVIRLLSLGLLLSSLGTVSSALLFRRLEFRKLFFVELGSYLPAYALVTIVLAVLGWGVWSLVAGALVQIAVRLALLTVAAPHSWAPSASRVETGELLHFGVGMTLARLANYAARSVDQLIVGRLLGPAALGLYLRANTLGSMSSGYLSAAVTTVLFPLYARIQDDPEKTRRWYLLSHNLVALVSIPLMALLAVAAPEILRVVYGPQWTEAAAPLRLCALAGIFRGLFTLSDALARAHARVYSQFARHLIFAVLVAGAALAGLPYGLAGVAAGVLLAVLVMWAMMGSLSLRLMQATWTELLASLRAGLALGMAVAAAGLAVAMLLRARHTPDLIVLLAVLACAGLIMLLGLRALPRAWLAGPSAALSDQLARFVPKPLMSWFKQP